MRNEKNLKQLFDEYVKECQFSARLSPVTLRGYKEVFHLFISIMPEVIDVRDLIPEMMVEFFKRIETRERIVGKNTIKKGIKKSTVKTYWSKLNSFFEWLYRKALILENPLITIKPPHTVYEDRRALTVDEIHKLYSAVTLLRRDTVMISLLIYCGLRRGEFISLEVSDIDFERRILTVRGQTSKSRKTRYMPIHLTLLFHLREYIKERNKCKYTTQYLIVSNKNDAGLSRQGLKHWVNKMSQKSGIKFHLHQFRHSFACILAKENSSAVNIQKLLGHSSLDMTMTYLRSIVASDFQSEIDKLNI
jgi:integrase/recombinase XerD